MLFWPVLMSGVLILAGCSPSVTCVPAPPGPEDLGPAAGLSTPPSNAVAFDLKYLPQTGAAGDIQYFSYWGFGGSDAEARTNSFLQDVRKAASSLHYVQSPSFAGRRWAAVEYHHHQATAFYFDLNADGKLGEGERILPTRKVSQGLEFITPDFIQPLEGGGQTLCRVLLQVNFYGGSEPNCMWSPAALLEGTATLNGHPARLLLFASGPGGQFDKYGSSSYSLFVGDQARAVPGQYVPRETLSSLVCSEGQFYHLTIEGFRTNGLPARALLEKDTSPTGELAVKLAATNSLHAAFGSLYLKGVNDRTVFLRVDGSKEKVSLPAGTYSLANGAVSYGVSDSREWEVSFSQGPWATIKAGEAFTVALGRPTLKVRAILERDRYNSQAVEGTTYKQGARIYLEPRIVGQSMEVFGRFREAAAGKADRIDRAPRITITAADGKQVLAQKMEYG